MSAFPVRIEVGKYAKNKNEESLIFVRKTTVTCLNYVIIYIKSHWENVGRFCIER